jgi:hypothetical protein
MWIWGEIPMFQRNIMSPSSWLKLVSTYDSSQSHNPDQQQWSLHLLALQSEVSKASTYMATKRLKCWPYKDRVLQELLPANWGAKSQYCRWFQEFIANRFHNLELAFFLDQAWFKLRGDVNSQNKRCQCSVVHEVPLQYVKNLSSVHSEWHKIIGPMFFKQ